jgi:hypothetical protein
VTELEAGCSSVTSSEQGLESYGRIAVEEDITYKYGAMQIPSPWAKFGFGNGVRLDNHTKYQNESEDIETASKQ